MTTADTITADEIAQNYSAAMDSVNLINQLMELSSRNDDQIATVARNVKHLALMVEKSYWTTENLKPLTDAINAGIDG